MRFFVWNPKCKYSFAYSWSDLGKICNCFGRLNCTKQDQPSTEKHCCLRDPGLLLIHQQYQTSGWGVEKAGVFNAVKCMYCINVNMSAVKEMQGDVSRRCIFIWSKGDAFAFVPPTWPRENSYRTFQNGRLNVNFVRHRRAWWGGGGAGRHPRGAALLRASPVERSQFRCDGPDATSRSLADTAVSLRLASPTAYDGSWARKSNDSRV